MITARLHDGKEIHFPDGTPDQAIDIAVKHIVSSAPQGIQLQVAKSPQDQQHDQALQQGLGAIMQHLANSQQHSQATHELLGHIANGQNQMAEHMNHGHQQIAQALNQQNQIAQAPLEAIRDKTGRITGSRKVIQHAAV